MLKRFFKRFYGAWLLVAQAIGWFNTRLFLALLFYLVIAPIGLTARLFRLDPLDQRLHTGSSYWYQKKRSTLNARYFIRQF